MHERRYARHGGWRRYDNYFPSRFGFGGPGYGGYGRKGMYGGYRSHYNYGYDYLNNYNPIYRNNSLPTVNANNVTNVSVGAKMTMKWLFILILLTLSFIAFE